MYAYLSCKKFHIRTRTQFFYSTYSISVTVNHTHFIYAYYIIHITHAYCDITVQCNVLPFNPFHFQYFFVENVSQDDEGK